MIIETWEMLLRVFLSAVLGGIIGLEREQKILVAGLRTHMLVGLGSCIFMLVSTYAYQDVVETQKVMLDPSRVAAGVVTGIGFLGAGTIIFYRQQIIKGLTTAAGLWTVSAVGLVVGAGFYWLALGCTLLIFVILGLIKKMELNMLARYKGYSIFIRYKADQKKQITELIEKNAEGIMKQHYKNANGFIEHEWLLKQSHEQHRSLHKELEDISGIEEMKSYGIE